MVKGQKQIVLQWVGSMLFRKMAEMLLQHNSKLALSEPHYDGELLRRTHELMQHIYIYVYTVINNKV
jgi:hypothetical protein